MNDVCTPCANAMRPCPGCGEQRCLHCDPVGGDPRCDPMPHWRRAWLWLVQRRWLSVEETTEP